MGRQQLTEHFYWFEFLRTSHGANVIPRGARDVYFARAKALAEVLEIVRAHFGGKPVKVNSGFRSVAVNAAVRGAKYSLHMLGLAVDFEIPGVSNEEIWRWIVEESGIAFSQCFLEFHHVGNPSSGWVHLAIPDPTSTARRIGGSTGRGEA